MWREKTKASKILTKLITEKPEAWNGLFTEMGTTPRRRESGVSFRMDSVGEVKQRYQEGS